LLKRGIVGAYHEVSKDYLPLYLNEFSFRHNNRNNPDAFRHDGNDVRSVAVRGSAR
jgi:ISXO2 transposase-like protein